MKVDPNVGNPQRRRRKGKRSSSTNSYASQKALSFHSPPIGFKSDRLLQTADAGAAGNGKTKGKEESKEIELMLDPDDKDSGTIKKKVLVLRNPDPESWICWQMEFEEICYSAPIKGAKLQAVSALQFLAGTAKEVWQKNYQDCVVEKAAELNEELSSEEKQAIYQKILDRTILACSREFFRMEQPERK